MINHSKLFPLIKKKISEYTGQREINQIVPGGLSFAFIHSSGIPVILIQEVGWVGC